VLRLARLASLSGPLAPAASAGEGLEERVVAALRTVLDPEIPVNIYDLGLIYGLDVGADGSVGVRMTLTAPACPVAGVMPGLVESAIRKVDGVRAVRVDLVWDPPWEKGRMSEAARLQLGLM
jgi:FeS assembly SUF system protein